MEKVHNLLTWKRPEDTKAILYALLAVFIATSLFSLDTVAMVMGFLLGVKLFIQDAMYDRYPRLKAKYDSTAKLWLKLPTNAQLEKSKARDAHNQHVLTANSQKLVKTESNSTADEGSDQGDIDEEDKIFCDNFNLPYEEKPIHEPAFKNWRSCFHYEKDTNISIGITSALNHHAKIYLTPSFICYEKRNEERHTIALSTITRLEKKKAISFLPGGGMALEISVAGFEKSQVFAGLIHRDRWYSKLMELGRKYKLQYADDYEEIKTDGLRLSDLDKLDDESNFELSAIPGGDLDSFHM